MQVGPPEGFSPPTPSALSYDTFRGAVGSISGGGATELRQNTVNRWETQAIARSSSLGTIPPHHHGALMLQTGHKYPALLPGPFQRSGARSEGAPLWASVESSEAHSMPDDWFPTEGRSAKGKGKEALGPPIPHSEDFQPAASSATASTSSALSTGFSLGLSASSTTPSSQSMARPASLARNPYLGHLSYSSYSSAGGKEVGGAGQGRRRGERGRRERRGRGDTL